MGGGGRENSIDLISVFASAGGVVDLSEVLSRLPLRFPIPILYHQPVSHLHAPGLARSLALHTDLNIVWLVNGTKLEGGNVYLCPAGYSMRVDDRVVTLVPPFRERGVSARARLLSSLVGCYGYRCAILLFNEAEAGTEDRLLQAHEKGGVVLTALQCRKGDTSAPCGPFGLSLSLADMASALARLVYGKRRHGPLVSPILGPMPRRPATELKQFLNHFTDLATRLHDTRMGHLQLYEQETRVLRIVVQRGFQREFLRYFWSVTPGDGSICGRAAQTRKTVVVQDIQRDKRFTAHRGVAVAAGFAATQSMPMIAADGELTGVISTHFKDRDIITPNMIRNLGIYAPLAADAIPRYTYPGKVGVAM